MDESWKMRMGVPNTYIRRRSMEDSHTRHSIEALHPEDFADVFGGPPRSVLSRKFSGDFTTPRWSSTSFYQEVFRPPELDNSAFEKARSKGGRSLPAFRIPAKGEGFYSDVFGWDDDGRRSRERSRPNSKAKSKSNSSSALSSEELSPHRRPVSGDDVALSSFASKLRPINVPCRWNSTTIRPEEHIWKQETPSFPTNSPSYADNYYMDNDYNDSFISSRLNVSRQVSSPAETISIEPTSFRSIKVSVDDLGLNSPSSPVSSLCQEPLEATVSVQCNDVVKEEVEDDEDEVMSSYVIEINSDHRGVSSEAISIDEAIAWAKEKFQSQTFDRQQNKDHPDESQEIRISHESVEQIDEERSEQSPMEKGTKGEEETEQSDQYKLKMELELLDEDVRLWSAGKETNIRLLLSTLHHILWPNSGWQAVAITALVEGPQVKKAYQKARLCLHPDKLQQRGATLPQKYVAEKAFSILQDAWAAFISQDVFF